MAFDTEFGIEVSNRLVESCSCFERKTLFSASQYERSDVSWRRKELSGRAPRIGFCGSDLLRVPSACLIRRTCSTIAFRPPAVATSMNGTAPRCYR